MRQGGQELVLQAGGPLGLGAGGPLALQQLLAVPLAASAPARAPLGRDVAEHQHHAQLCWSAVDDGGGAVVDGRSRRPGRPAVWLASPTTSPCAAPVAGVVDRPTAVLVDAEHLVELPALGGLAGPAGEGLGHRVQEGDPGRPVGGDDRVADARQGHPEALALLGERPLGLLALGDVDGHPPSRRAALIVAHDVAGERSAGGSPRAVYLTRGSSWMLTAACSRAHGRGPPSTRGRPRVDRGGRPGPSPTRWPPPRRCARAATAHRPRRPPGSAAAARGQPDHHRRHQQEEPARSTGCRRRAGRTTGPADVRRPGGHQRADHWPARSAPPPKNQAITRIGMEVEGGGGPPRSPPGTAGDQGRQDHAGEGRRILLPARPIPRRQRRPRSSERAGISPWGAVELSGAGDDGRAPRPVGLEQLARRRSKAPPRAWPETRPGPRPSGPRWHERPPPARCRRWPPPPAGASSSGVPSRARIGSAWRSPRDWSASSTRRMMPRKKRACSPSTWSGPRAAGSGGRRDRPTGRGRQRRGQQPARSSRSRGLPP